MIFCAFQKDRLNRAGKNAVMYAAEAGRLEVRFQNTIFLKNEDDIHNQLLFFQLGGAVVASGIRRGKMGRGGQSRAEKQIRQARSIFCYICTLIKTKIKFSSYKGSGAKSQVTNGPLIYGEIFAHLLIY
jgi:hypothetical protein